MRRWILVGALVLATVQGACADNFIGDVLNAHNIERGGKIWLHSRLSWAPSLASDALCWAKQQARAGQMQHSPYMYKTKAELSTLTADQLAQSCDTSGEPYGENIYSAWPPGGMTPVQMIQQWAAEKADFKFGTFPDVANDNNVRNVEHYTQIIWGSTRLVGCGLATGKDQDGHLTDYFVCRYSPPGNMNGVPMP